MHQVSLSARFPRIKCQWCYYGLWNVMDWFRKIQSPTPPFDRFMFSCRTCNIFWNALPWQRPLVGPTSRSCTPPPMSLRPCNLITWPYSPGGRGMFFSLLRNLCRNWKHETHLYWVLRRHRQNIIQHWTLKSTSLKYCAHIPTEVLIKKTNCHPRDRHTPDFK